MPNKANGQDSLLVEVTARLKLSIDNTWELVSFKRDTAKILVDDPKQTVIYKPHKPLIYKREPRFDGPIEYTGEVTTIKPASWYLDHAKEVQKRKSNNYKGRPIGRINHCSRCGMENKNKLTCMSVSREDGTFESYKHRKIYL
jgi:hypothetical protein